MRELTQAELKWLLEVGEVDFRLEPGTDKACEGLKARILAETVWKAHATPEQRKLSPERKAILKAIPSQRGAKFALSPRSLLAVAATLTLMALLRPFVLVPDSRSSRSLAETTPPTLHMKESQLPPSAELPARLLISQSHGVLSQITTTEPGMGRRASTPLTSLPPRTLGATPKSRQLHSAPPFQMASLQATEPFWRRATQATGEKLLTATNGRWGWELRPPGSAIKFRIHMGRVRWTAARNHKQKP